MNVGAGNVIPVGKGDIITKKFVVGFNVCEFLMLLVIIEGFVNNFRSSEEVMNHAWENIINSEELVQ